VRRFESCRGHFAKGLVTQAFSVSGALVFARLGAAGTYRVHSSGSRGVHRRGDLVQAIAEQVPVLVERAAQLALAAVLADRLPRRLGARLGEQCDLGVGEELPFRTDDPRQVDARRGVAVLDRGGEDERQDPVHLADGGRRASGR
jgi:hypothetical protein